MNIDEEDKKNETAIKLADAFTNTTKLGAMTLNWIATSGRNNFDINAAHEEIKKQASKILRSDFSTVESMLTVQSLTLDALFNEMLRRSLDATNSKAKRFYMDAALRAQNQGRKTLLALDAIKHPSQKQIIGQQYIASNQQVNNGIKSENLKKSKNTTKK